MDIRVQRTYDMLKEAFISLIEQKPLDEISVTEICERSTVRRATFYRHFEDKYALCAWYLNETTNRFLTEMDESTPTEDLETYATLMHLKFITSFEAQGNIVRNVLGQRAGVRTLDMVTIQVADGIKKRIVSNAPRFGWKLNISSDFAGDFYSAGIVYTLREWLQGTLECTKEELATECTKYLMCYLDATRC